jgi:uncharacterized membrane protein YdjX (TVP38/TMEM64 family)
VGLVPGTVLHVTIGATVGTTSGPVLLVSLLPLGLALAALAVGRIHYRRRAGARAAL